MRYLQVAAAEAGQRLDNYLLRHLAGVPKARVYRLLRRGEVRVDSHRAKPEHRLQVGETVRIPPVREATPAGPMPVSADLTRRLRTAILYEDPELIAIDKPAGLPVHGGSGVAVGLIEAMRVLHPKLPYLELAHRLDRDTSGCLLLAKSRAMLTHLHALLRDGGIDKQYRVLVAGAWQLGEQRVEAAIGRTSGRDDARLMGVSAGGRHAVTRLTPIQVMALPTPGQDSSIHYPAVTLLAVRLDTGRTHQIRVHCAYLGHPVAGDRKYGDFAFNRRLQALGLHRLFLHAAEVRFPALQQRQDYRIVAPLPAELNAVLNRLNERDANES